MIGLVPADYGRVSAIATSVSSETDRDVFVSEVDSIREMDTRAIDLLPDDLQLHIIQSLVILYMSGTACYSYIA